MTRNTDEGVLEQRVAGWLDELGDANPPDTLVGEVMQRVHGLAARRTRKVTTPIFGGTIMAKKLLWGVAAAAAVVLIAFAVTGYPPIDRGVEGVIGAAKRYQSDQISTPDVVLGDVSAQQFLQSDEFARLLKDPASVRLLSDRSVREALQSPDILAAVNSAELARLAQNAARADLSADVRALAATNAQVSAALQNNVMARSLADGRLWAAVRSDAFREALTSNGFAPALSTAQMANAIAANVAAQ